MAFNLNMGWEIRTTGSDNNGGGFVALATGTDYSQQDSPQISYTDLVIGATNTTMTSVAHPFTSAHVGNVINVISGTGFTVQRVQVVSVSGVVATLDKACGTAASTAGVGNLGGGLTTIAKCFTVAITGNTAWVKAGTYTQTVALNMPGSIFLIGYSTTHGDNGLATITTATNSVQLFTEGGTVTEFTVANFILSNTASTPSTCFSTASQQVGLACFNTEFIGFSTAITGANYSFIYMQYCYFTGLIGVNAAGLGTASHVVFDACYFDTLTTSSVTITGNNGLVSFRNCIVANCAIGIQITVSAKSNLIVENCTIANNTGNAVNIGLMLNSNSLATNGGLISVRSCVIYGNTGWGVISTFAFPGQTFMSNNALGSNSSGNYSGVSSVSDVAITANPFATGTKNYALNAVAGGGAACKGVGWPNTFPGGTTIGTPDIGAVQSAGGSGATGGSYAYVG